MMRSINVRILGPMLREVAKNFLNFEIVDFQASAGWLEKLKLRYEISEKVLYEESNEVLAEVVEKFVEKFTVFVNCAKDGNIFNADECDLFFKAISFRGLVIKGDSCKRGCERGKLSTEHLNVFLCSSMTGEKLKSTVIGKSAKTRAIKNVKPEDAPVFYFYFFSGRGRERIDLLG